jgi:hypothetical protein
VFFCAVSLGTIRGLEEAVIKALYKKVFGNKSIQLPFKPSKDETLEELVKRYYENKLLYFCVSYEFIALITWR